MVTLDLPTLIGVGVPLVGVIVWLVRLEGRINTHDQSLEQVRADVQYIRSRIDQALSRHD